MMNRLRTGRAAAASKSTDTDRAKLKRAFLRIEEVGGMTLTGMCCQSCSWAALAERCPDEPTDIPVAHYNAQSEHDAFGSRRNGMLRDELTINHSGDSKAVVGALEAEGLNVVWNGDVSEAILVRPRTLH